MHLPGSRRRRLRSLAVAGAVVLAAIGPAPLAGAADSTGAVDDGLSDEEVSELVVDLLVELGVPAERVDGVVAGVLDGVADRLNLMVDEGFVTVEQLGERNDVRADAEAPPPPETYPTNAPPVPTAPPPAASYPDTGPTLGDPPPPPAAAPTAVLEAPQ